MAEDAPMAVAEPEVVDIESAEAKVKQGKDLIDEDPEKAVEVLCAAVRAYEKHYGSDAIECAPVYMYYGIALYEVARGATDALGATKTTVEPIPAPKSSEQAATAPAEAGNDDTTGAKNEAKTGAAVDQDGKAAAAAAEPVPAEESAAAKPVNADAEADKENTAADGEAEGDDEGDKDEGGGNDDGGDADGAGGEKQEKEDPTSDDMKLAWDMLEVARVLYDKAGDPAQHHARLAEVHKALGDIEGEQERFEEAVDCYKQSLHHLESMQPRNNRRLAEVQYKYSVILTYLDQPEEALTVTHAALTSLEAAVAETEEKLAALPADGSGGEAAEEEGRRLQAVSEDLRDVIAELHCNADGLKETIASDNSFKEAIRQAFLKANGGGAEGAAEGLSASAAPLAAAAAAAVAGKLSNAFSAPSNPGAAAQTVSLGTVGRGSKRITLQPANTNKVAPAPAAAEAPGKPVVASASTKRTLDDLMGGGAAVGGVTTTGFGAVAVVEKKGGEDGGKDEDGQEDGQAAKKARTEAPVEEAAAMADV